MTPTTHRLLRRLRDALPTEFLFEAFFTTAPISLLLFITLVYDRNWARFYLSPDFSFATIVFLGLAISRTYTVRRRISERVQREQLGKRLLLLLLLTLFSAVALGFVVLARENQTRPPSMQTVLSHPTRDNAATPPVTTNSTTSSADSPTPPSSSLAPPPDTTDNRGDSLRDWLFAIQIGLFLASIGVICMDYRSLRKTASGPPIGSIVEPDDLFLYSLSTLKSAREGLFKVSKMLDLDRVGEFQNLPDNVDRLAELRTGLESVRNEIDGLSNDKTAIERIATRRDRLNDLIQSIDSKTTEPLSPVHEQ